ncbi:hypothetical protein LG200_01240 [Methylobacillus caricis]|uniref:hypothetical protein n=1 Tax=Methylobacillus caricis TaxID=1971611 RepID=UPI001CFF89AE|nr:hypothetical protein [Methylobacillus caricis]MCB5186625.1 hypothetical protein [Methylobacillus caricis]
MRLSKSKFFAAIILLILVWVAFTQIRMVDGSAVDTAKAAALKEIENSETAKFDNIEKIEHGETTVVCGQYSVKDAGGNYTQPRNFSVIVQEPNSKFSESEEDFNQYCSLPGKR